MSLVKLAFFKESLEAYHKYRLRKKVEAFKDKVTSSEVAKEINAGNNPVMVSRPIDENPTLKQNYPSVIVLKEVK